MKQPERKTPDHDRAGEVFISGVDTGPRDTERENSTPTEEQARLHTLANRSPESAAEEKEDEDA